MAVMPWVAGAQVKQVYKVIDFDTKQPVAGATTRVYGQKITTDAKGVAVATLPADKKDAFLLMEDEWTKDGYFQIGHAPESFYVYFQTKDTVKFYMAEKKAYRAEARAMFDALYGFLYDTVIRYTSKVYMDSIAKYPEQTSVLAQD